MKNGIVFEIQNGQAVILRPSGAFVTVPAQPCWRKGDVVSLKRPHSHRFRMLYSAACIAIFLGALFGGWQIYHAPAALVSLDVNPSIELQTNCFDRILSVRAYNAEGETLLSPQHLTNCKLTDALETLFASGLTDYLLQSPYLTFSVQSASETRCQSLIALLQQKTDALRAEYPAVNNAVIDCFSVDAAFVESAHSHHVTAGKYKLLLELQQVMPNIDFDAYTHCSVAQLHDEILSCQAVPQTQPEPVPDNPAPPSEPAPSYDASSQSGHHGRHHN